MPISNQYKNTTEARLNEAREALGKIGVKPVSLEAKVESKQTTEAAEPLVPADKPAEKGAPRGRPACPFSNESLKPWEAEGVSRNTWYVRQRVRRAAEEAVRAALTPSKPLPKAAPKPAPEPEPDSDDEWWSTKTKT